VGRVESAGDLLERASDTAETFRPETHRRRIRALKQTLRNSPRNVLPRADLALEYTGLGLLEQALKAMDVALRLAPDDRFILRSAARLLVHVGDSDGALEVLRHSDRTKIDPWLSAAEISIASTADRPSRFAKRAAHIVTGDRFPARQTTELASALATLEASTGAVKKALRLFRRSLVDPTENVVAQATWAAQRLDINELQPQNLDVPGSFEARALTHVKGGDFAVALDATWKWLADQTFSKTAAVFAVTHVSRKDQLELARPAGLEPATPA
jgi:tetratricopeptide (TPR) repeat protein